MGAEPLAFLAACRFRGQITAMMTPARRRLAFTLAGLFAVLATMTVLTSYSVTLYRLFCEATGAGGTTRRVAADDAAVSSRTVSVSFDTSVAPGLPWRFRPMQRRVRLHLGEDTLVFFEAENLSDHDIVGHATFNVTPDQAGPYFKKIQCFCFTEERLAAHAKVQMPVDFFVDPRFATDRDTRDVSEITLSYTFFPSRKPQGATDLARFGDEDAAAGAQLFAAQCSGCHAADHSKVGPPLAGVVGRAAASVPGYPYSTALAQSGLVWSDANLARWLAGPAAMVPGAAMPMSLPDVEQRKAIIAYLRTLQPAG